MDIDNLTEEDCRLLDIISWEGQIVKHFKGDYYLILDTDVQHTETNERMIYYKALYGECETYIRPAIMFIEKCTEDQYKIYKQEYRFQPVQFEKGDRYEN